MLYVCHTCHICIGAFKTFGAPEYTDIDGHIYVSPLAEGENNSQIIAVHVNTLGVLPLYSSLPPQADPCVTSPVSPGLDGVSPHCVNASIPSLLSMPTRNHMDITTPPLPLVAPEVLRVAEHRHKKGLMYPYIYHVLTKVRGHRAISHHIPVALV